MSSCLGLLEFEVNSSNTVLFLLLRVVGKGWDCPKLDFLEVFVLVELKGFSVN